MTTARFISVSPFLATEDVPSALAFYQDTLGFALAWEWGSPVEMAAVCRDAVEITLTSRPDARPPGISRLYVAITGIDQYYAGLQQAGVHIVVPLGDRPYGMRDFSIADPFGNELCFGQPTQDVEQREATP